MLNLPIAMIKLFLLLSLLFQDPAVTLTSPQPGDILRGQVEIAGVMDVPNFASAELAFSYVDSASDSAVSWFAIQTFLQPVADPIIAIWDTSAVTDGDYVLRLRVYLQDGTSLDASIVGLKIRNDVPLPTETPEETFQIATPVIIAEEVTQAAPLPSPTFVFVRPTVLPLSNPASLNAESIYPTLGRGALTAFILFILFSLILRLRKN